MKTKRKEHVVIVNGFEITESALNNAFFLLGQLMARDPKMLKKVVESKSYRTVLIRKNNGGRRRLDIPNADLKKVQKRLLESCLCHIAPWGLPDFSCLKGFMKRVSTRHNVEPHVNGKAFFQLDIADAFPSTKTETIRDALELMLDPAIVKRMFRFKDVRWFRRQFLDNQDQTQIFHFVNEHPIDTLWALREIILELTTFSERLPQGAPTSPYLFNLVVAMQGIPTLIRDCLPPDGYVITVYADNVTISTCQDSIPAGTRQSVIDAINTKTCFRVNPEKTHYWIMQKGSRTITGLSIGIRDGERAITLPQSTQRKVRGLLHKAKYNRLIRPQALGWIAYLRGIYGEELPQQIEKPYQQLLAVMKK